jgi:hypothetical protein
VAEEEAAIWRRGRAVRHCRGVEGARPLWQRGLLDDEWTSLGACCVFGFLGNPLIFSPLLTETR